MKINESDEDRLVFSNDEEERTVDGWWRSHDKAKVIEEVDQEAPSSPTHKTFADSVQAVPTIHHAFADAT